MPASNPPPRAPPAHGQATMATFPRTDLSRSWPVKCLRTWLDDGKVHLSDGSTRPATIETPWLLL
ncbi:MAG: hypothetical protein OXF67_06585 [Cyanobacteria bacterium MAG CAR4_bin_6]|nr:hypothetical protein [Cyanobacteria bacterium MAG CAR4_bin_6]